MPMISNSPDAEGKVDTGSALDFSVRGVQGVRHSNGQILDERMPKLRGRNKMLLYREMADNCPVSGAILYSMKTWVSAINWWMQARRQGHPECERWAWFAESCMHDMAHTWDDFIWQNLSHLDYGYSLSEICYKRRLADPTSPLTKSAYADGYIGWRKLAYRSQDTLDAWAFDPATGNLAGMWQQVPLNAVARNTSRNGRLYIPLAKSLLFRTQLGDDNPEGRSVLRNAVIPYLAKRRIIDIELIGIERDLVGLPDMQLPAEMFGPGRTADDETRIREWGDIVSSIRRDELEGLVRPSEMDADNKPTGYKFSLLTSGGERQIDIDKVIRRNESRIAMSVLAEFLMIGVEKGGGIGGGSLQENKTDVFALSLSAVPRRMCAVLNKYAIRPLCLINGCPPEYVPELKHSDVAAPSLDTMAKYVSALSAAGMLMYDVRTEHKLREMADLPQRDETETGGREVNSMGGREQGQAPADEAAASGIPDAATDPMAGGRPVTAPVVPR